MTARKRATEGTVTFGSTIPSSSRLSGPSRASSRSRCSGPRTRTNTNGTEARGRPRSSSFAIDSSVSVSNASASSSRTSATASSRHRTIAVSDGQKPDSRRCAVPGDVAGPYSSAPRLTPTARAPTASRGDRGDTANSASRR